MGNEIKIVKSVIGADKSSKVLNRSFETFTKPVQPQETDTIEELFRLYDLLYYSIPVDGATLSHEYLIVESSKLKKFQADDFEDIQPLLDEIAQLRQQLLDAEQQILELETQLDS